MTRWLGTVMLRIRSLLRKGQVEQELHDELTFHLDGLIEDYRQRGLTPEAARLAALRELGPVESLKEECRDARGVTYLEQFVGDVRLAVRAFLRQPSFTVVALLVLALGIGANTAIYTLVDAVAWRPLPVDRPQDLYRVGDTNACCVNSGLSGDTSLFSYAFYHQLRDHAPAFSALAAFQVVPESLSARRGGAADKPQAISTEFVSGSYFETLRAGMAAGRSIRPDDDRRGAPPVGVLSYHAWRDEYGLDPALLGGTLVVGGSPVTVVGVAAPTFFGETLRPNPVELWLPLATEFLLGQNRQGIVSATGASTSLLDRPDQQWLYVIGRLRAGVTRAAAQDEASLALRLWLGGQRFLSADERAKIPAQHVIVTSFETGVSPLRARYRESLSVLAIVSGLVLVLACANLGNLMLARAQPFQLALRAALGASQGRLIRATLTSGLVLAVAGGAAGVLFAYAATRLILDTAFPGALRPHRREALCTDSRVCRPRVYGDRSHLQRPARVADVEDESDRGASERRARDGPSIHGPAADPDRSADRRLARAGLRSRPAHAQPAALGGAGRVPDVGSDRRSNRPGGSGLFDRSSARLV